jgi:hypothetical protein
MPLRLPTLFTVSTEVLCRGLAELLPDRHQGDTVGDNLENQIP